LERELAELRREVSELRCDVGYWKSRHADALKRNEQLTEELHQAQGQIRSLQDKLFGRKSEKLIPKGISGIGNQEDAGGLLQRPSPGRAEFDDRQTLGEEGSVACVADRSRLCYHDHSGPWST
jgi:hypothetical protein